MRQSTQKQFYKRWWFWLIVVIFVIGSVAALTTEDEQAQNNNTNTQQTEANNEQDETKRAEAKAKADKLVVSSQIVKQVGNDSYDYWFNIENTNDSDVDFKIKTDILYSDGEEVYTIRGAAPDFAELSISSGFHRQVRNHTNASPSSGVTKFRYSIQLDGFTFEYPEGAITSELEDARKL